MKLIPNPRKKPNLFLLKTISFRNQSKTRSSANTAYAVTQKR